MQTTNTAEAPSPADGPTAVPSPSEVLRRRVRAIRDQRGMSAQALADAVQSLGGTLDRAAISKIEVGRRGVSLDEVFILAAALNTAPIHLIVPTDDSLVAVGPARVVSAAAVRQWAGGRQALPGQDEADYFANAAGEDRARHTATQHPAYKAAQRLAGTVHQALIVPEGMQPATRQLRDAADLANRGALLLADELDAAAAAESEAG